MAGSNWTILATAELQEHHSLSRTVHTTNGVPFPPFTKLEIGKYSGDKGFYLLHLCSDGQVADTWHESLDDAFHQAEYEFGIHKSEWIIHP
jgi:hypothetical protein